MGDIITIRNKKPKPDFATRHSGLVALVLAFVVLFSFSVTTFFIVNTLASSDAPVQTHTVKVFYHHIYLDRYQTLTFTNGQTFQFDLDDIDGFLFQGWYIRQNGNYVEYTPTTVTSDFELFAEWVKYEIEIEQASTFCRVYQDLILNAKKIISTFGKYSTDFD